MSEAIGIRIEDDFLEKIEKLSKEEVEDRSTIMRKLLSLGYTQALKKRAAESYQQGKITLSEAAARAEITIWEMEKFLVEQGFVSSYSLEDLQEEVRSVLKNRL